MDPLPPHGSRIQPADPRLLSHLVRVGVPFKAIGYADAHEGSFRGGIGPETASNVYTATPEMEY
jgi:hypothetical protein